MLLHRIENILDFDTLKNNMVFSNETVGVIGRMWLRMLANDDKDGWARGSLSSWNLYKVSEWVQKKTEHSQPVGCLCGVRTSDSRLRFSPRKRRSDGHSLTATTPFGQGNRGWNDNLGCKSGLSQRLTTQQAPRLPSTPWHEPTETNGRSCYCRRMSLWQQPLDQDPRRQWSIRGKLLAHPQRLAASQPLVKELWLGLGHLSRQCRGQEGRNGKLFGTCLETAIQERETSVVRTRAEKKNMCVVAGKIKSRCWSQSRTNAARMHVDSCTG